ncbi:hypothetical protein LPJ78_000046 [Coemansia sp. RSA 989]|nr:hypothetical protein LPJ68_000094 [Coemansia sp. RSA 1086]KAJ1753646.1 hypothetical protein LPJ79_000239 [Coemansia sp. RSA 1821]KAJ1868534.1 hypothetical protein LPJ78_000046 [Coemansia sp. RSA 989]KAJ1876144.1 hypothetical protein LPJ55_000046 [Coemansia sp. RSA 990]
MSSYHLKHNFGPQVARTDHDDAQQDACKEEYEPEASEQPHHWRTRPPLLPPRVATLVSTVSGATRLSLEITALFWEAVFETISDSTSSGRWLGSTAFHEAKLLMEAAARMLSPLSSLNPRIVARIVGSSTALGYSIVNRSLAATESLVEGGFTLYTRAVNVGLHAAGEYVRLIDAIFGSTDTSRVLASFMHMCRKEALENNPEIRALVKEHGLVSFVSQVLKTVVAWICLQVVTHGRAQPYRLELVYTNMRSSSVLCPRKYVSSTGKPIKGRAPAEPKAAESKGSSPLQISPLILPARGSNLSDEDGCSGLRQRAATLDNLHSHDGRLDLHGECEDSDGAMLALSDQEGAACREVEWSRRLVEALHGLSTQGKRADGSPQLPPTRSSIWNTLNSVREAAAAAASARQQEDQTDDDSDLLPASMRRSSISALSFESAPASLVSSPQLPNTPYEPQLPVRRSSTTTESTLLKPDICTAACTKPPSANSLGVSGMDGPSIAPVLDPAPEPLSQNMLQDFPRKPLLFNLARFISVASSAYGQSFMQVIGLDDGVIDARALIDAYGDDGMEAPGSRVSRTGSVMSMENHDAGAQPMSPLYRSPAHAPASPHKSKPSRPGTPGGRRAAGSRKPYLRRPHHGRRPVYEHPNHFSFSQHTGIPLSDLLFSSYVSPIVPGVTNAASVRASEVERRLRHKRSQSVKNAMKEEQVDKEKQQALAAETRKAVPAVQLPAEVASPKGWLASIPVVGSIYQSLPSPMGALQAVPGLVLRALGTQQPSPPPESDQQSGKSKREPTTNQFRRFDKIRRRLVYRNPSIHALVHYIAVDHATRSVVLACRGTLGISDLFIDMICEYENVNLPGPHERATGKHTEFRVHSGMWHSAMLLADTKSEVFKEVAEALRLYPEYGLVITGHSLGGGVASLLTLLWSQPLFGHDSSAQLGIPGCLAGTARHFATSEIFGLVAPRPIHCFSFGSPCSTNAPLSYYCRGLVTSVVNTDDFVSFLSIGACMDILNISAVLSHERGVAEKVVRGFLSAQRTKLGQKLNWFDFDFSRLRAYEPDSGENSEDDSSSDTKCSDGGWNYKTSQSNGDKIPSRSSSPVSDVDDWHLSLIKTLRASMDSEKLYPPGDVFILASPGDDEVADRHLPELKPSEDKQLPVGLFYCPDVAERFTELRFTRNMIVHHLPSTYERRLSALVHESVL